MKLRSRVIVWLMGIFTASTFLQIATRGATIRDDQPGSSYLDLASSLAYAPVGLFVNSWGYTGCATLIAPDWVLTAAHNLTAASSGTFTIGGNSYSSAQLVAHPLWNGDTLNGYDLALVRLGNPVAAVAPAALYPGSLEIGQTATFVGFGFTGTGVTGWQSLDNQKRAFQNFVDGDFGNPSVLLGIDFDNPSVLLGIDFDNPHTTTDNAFGAAMALALEGCVAPGDSGGGVFLTVGAQTYLAGVISFVAATDGSANADYGDVSGFGRVSTFVPWITSTVPEPASPMLLVLAGLAALFRRPRRRMRQE